MMKMRKFLFSGVGVLWICAFVAAVRGEGSEEGKDDDDVTEGVVVGPRVGGNVPEVLGNPNDHKFEAEVSHLMNIIVNSLYTDRDVFLRELISNAADAIEKVRLLALRNETALVVNGDQVFDKFEIFIDVDKDKGEISVTDSGIGMTQDELVNNLGTIANSGTGKFLANALSGGTSTTSSNMIGQFGVGFYSAFLVADQVTVVSKHPSEEDQYVWRSAMGHGGFTVGKDPRGATLKRGTSVSLKIKKDQKRYLDYATLKKIVQRFSEFVGVPIYMKNSEAKWMRLNPNEPLWLKEKSAITQDEYNHFYRIVAKDTIDPLAQIHFKAEGDVNFRSILYLPSHTKDFANMVASDSKQSAIRLFVRRVLIADNLENLLPRWLGFVKGVIDSDDLPLKVDRETFSEGRIMKSIRSTVVRKTFELFSTITKSGEKEYPAFMEEAQMIETDTSLSKMEREQKIVRLADAKYPDYKRWMTTLGKYGQSLVLGCAEDASKDEKKKILDLMRFPSSKSPRHPTGFDQYTKRMNKHQKKIYYMTGDSVEALLESPYLEVFRERDVEVVFFIKPLEEQCAEQVKNYKKLPLISIEKGTQVDLSELIFEDDEVSLAKLQLEADRHQKGVEVYYKPLVDWVQEHLGLTKAQYVQMSKVLVRSPAMVSVPDHGLTATAERLFKASALANTASLDAFAAMKTFEMNGNHPFIHHLLTLLAKTQNEKNENKKLKMLEDLKLSTDILYESSLIASGFQPRRPHLVINKLYTALNQEVGIEKAILTTLKEENPTNKKFDKIKIPNEIMKVVDEKLEKKKRLSSDDEADDDGEEMMFEDAEDLSAVNIQDKLDEILSHSQSEKNNLEKGGDQHRDLQDEDLFLKSSPSLVVRESPSDEL